MANKKTVEEALRQAEEKYRNIYENAIEGIFQTSPEGRFISANPALARILGYDSPEELIEGVRDVAKQVYVREGQRQEYVRLMEAEGLARNFEAEVCCRDGSVQWVSLNARAVRNAEGSVLYHEGTMESITERKKLEAQLLHAERMQSVGNLAGGVAHDFNNILTTVMGYCSLILMKAGPDNQLAGYVNQIMEAAERASALTQNLLAFSRRQPIETKAVDVNESMKVVGKLLRRIIGEDIELRTSLSKEKLTVLIGEGQIGQILMNLATNARDAMPAGGILSIKTEKVHLGGNVLKAYDGMEGACACIEVSDTGSGMNESVKDQIFDPFFTTKEVGKGTGLGLSIVYGIVSQNKGRVDVESRPGSGTTFTIYLPLTEPASSSVTPEGKEELRGGNEVILVAEDNNDVRQIVTTVLRDFGYVVIEAADGVEAVEKFKEQKDAVDLLLFDIIMPRKNGKDAYLELKEMRPDIRAIFMSGYTGDILSRKGIGREGVPVISKPVVIEKLLRQIRDILDTKPAQLTLFP